MANVGGVFLIVSLGAISAIFISIAEALLNVKRIADTHKVCLVSHHWNESPSMNETCNIQIIYLNNTFNHISIHNLIKLEFKMHEKCFIQVLLYTI